MKKGDSGLGFGLVCCSLLLCASSVGGCTVLFKVSIRDPLFATGSERTDKIGGVGVGVGDDRIGGVGDGDEGGLKLSYLKTCMPTISYNYSKRHVI